MPDAKPLALLTLQASKSEEAMAAFEREGFVAESHPLVLTKPLPDDEAERSLDWGDLASGDGLVVTSASAVEAALRALARATGPEARALGKRLLDSSYEILAVGEATARLCRELIRPRVAVSGGQGQEGLAEWFRRRREAGAKKSNRAWWMPCSRLASKRLAEDAAALGIRVAMTPLYGPAPSPEGARGLLARLRELARQSADAPRWLAVYSPSAAQALASGASGEALRALRMADVGVAALGKTTAAAWRDEFGVDPDATGPGTGSAELAKALARWRA